MNKKIGYVKYRIPVDWKKAHRLFSLMKPGTIIYYRPCTLNYTDVSRMHRIQITQVGTYPQCLNDRKFYIKGHLSLHNEAVTYNLDSPLSVILLEAHTINPEPDDLILI